MACACKVNQEIDKINKYYSYNKKSREETPKMSINKKDAAITILAYILLLPVIPIVLVFVVLFSIFSKDKKISLGNFLGFIHKVRNDRKQQNIQDTYYSRA
jgi:hypothetical protein